VHPHAPLAQCMSSHGHRHVPSVAPPRYARPALLLARLGKHLAGASSPCPKAARVGLTSSRERRAIASPLTNPFSADGVVRLDPSARHAAKHVVQMTAAGVACRAAPALCGCCRRESSVPLKLKGGASFLSGSPPLGRCVLEPDCVLRDRLRSLRCRATAVCSPPKGLLTSLCASPGDFPACASSRGAPRVSRVSRRVAPEGPPPRSPLVTRPAHLRRGSLRPRSSS
jgi:hypothetical protein